MHKVIAVFVTESPTLHTGSQGHATTAEGPAKRKTII